MTRQFAPPTSPALAIEIEHGWRNDTYPGAVDDKNLGVDGRRAIRRDYERAAREAGEGSEP